LAAKSNPGDIITVSMLIIVRPPDYACTLIHIIRILGNA
jgi:hypothetical protein